MLHEGWSPPPVLSGALQHHINSGRTQTSGETWAHLNATARAEANRIPSHQDMGCCPPARLHSALPADAVSADRPSFTGPFVLPLQVGTTHASFHVPWRKHHSIDYYGKDTPSTGSHTEAFLHYLFHLDFSEPSQGFSLLWKPTAVHLHFSHDLIKFGLYLT